MSREAAQRYDKRRQAPPRSAQRTASVDITINSVNDAPAGTNKTVTVNEDNVYTFATCNAILVLLTATTARLIH